MFSPDFIFKLLTNTQNIIAGDPETHGSMLVPVILGSDKTSLCHNWPN